ncbi:hypothetical protein JY651_10800 [Pyxidicoccus parkwayensis]|uniref:Uncharacterized protein n=1 Tax=Pyxidicoccus parkwayensis TaxID=2813578 RepID=A0ABX7P4Q2_9BACT|nr:hypothetical protein [Pyxidicoccus parkwaysis]QSQ25377.1 hypothetical protein JY651_10800 [Pyxidicoccus parkwaysis]
MRMDTLKSRRRAAALLLGLSALAGLLPETALALEASALPKDLAPQITLAQYGTSRRVARRTSRRTAARHSGGYGAYGYGAAAVGVGIATIPVGVSYVTALPTGCGATTVNGITYQQCGAVRYRPYYQGETLVYVKE